MAEVTQYMFNHHEIIESLVKKLDIHEGHWAIAIEFTMAAITAGPTPETQFPSCVAGVSKIGIQRSENELHHTVNAAEINPVRSQKAVVKQPGKRKPV